MTKNITNIIVGESVKNAAGFQNRLYHGDNLLVMKKLVRDDEVKGRVRLIYIDPPFATGQNFTLSEKRSATISRENGGETAYSDTLTGEAYLDYLRKRLILMREILANDGTIYVHIDCKVGHYVKVLMDEVFGADRFINDVTRIKCNPKNFERKGFGNVKDMILIYSKTGAYIWNDKREPFSGEDIKRLYPKIEKDGRRYTSTPLHAPGETVNGATGQKWKGLDPPEGRHWRYKPEELTRLDDEGLIEWSSNNNPRLKIYADDALIKGKKIQDVWEFKDPQYPEYPTEKNLDMLKLIVETSSNPGDIVMDCFAGSGTTLIAAEALGRNWIGIDDSEFSLEVITKKINYNNYKFTKINDK